MMVIDVVLVMMIVRLVMVGMVVTAQFEYLEKCRAIRGEFNWAKNS